MKKIFTLIALLSVASCWSGGRFDFWEGRNTWLEDMDSYGINFFGQEPKLLNSEIITKKDYKPNQVLTAYKGYSIANIKTYSKETFASTKARINKQGTLHSSAAPVSFKKNEVRDIIGSTNIDGVEYYLIPTDMETFVHIINDDGSFYKKMGQIRNEKLVLIDTEYFPSPKDLRFEPITTSSTIKTEPIKGFDIKFDGVNNGKINFLYLDYAEVEGDAGSFQNLTYKNQSGEIDIFGVKVKIIFADEQKLDYEIME